MDALHSELVNGGPISCSDSTEPHEITLSLPRKLADVLVDVDRSAAERLNTIKDVDGTLHDWVQTIKGPLNPISNLVVAYCYHKRKSVKSERTHAKLKKQAAFVTAALDKATAQYEALLSSHKDFVKKNIALIKANADLREKMASLEIKPVNALKRSGHGKDSSRMKPASCQKKSTKSSVTKNGNATGRKADIRPAFLFTIRPRATARPVRRHTYGGLRHQAALDYSHAQKLRSPK